MNLLLTGRQLIFWQLNFYVDNWSFWQLFFLAIELLDNWSFAKLVSRPDVQKLLTFCPSFPFPAFHQFPIPLEKLVHVPYSLRFVRFSRGLVHFIAEQHTFESSLWLFSSTLPSLLAYFVSVMGGRKQSHRSSLCACELNRRPFSLLHEFGVRSTNFTREGSGIRLMTAAALAWSLRVPNIRC